jgi:hypothetical protein
MVHAFSKSQTVQDEHLQYLTLAGKYNDTIVSAISEGK